VDAAVEARQIGRLRAVRAGRDQAEVSRLLDRLAAAAADPGANVMGPTIEAVKAKATLGEIVARLRGLWGSYVERPVF
jgi:methylmalonyl-CoA mutase N-terminal domain/subunit